MAGSAVLGDGPAFAPRMTRCECAELSFEEVVRQVREEGRSLEAIQDRTGCGRLCTACLPDLREHLAARSQPG
jgi:bacterioferritin-associated ferredoxin